MSVLYKKWELSINIKKTKYILLNKIDVGPTALHLEGDPIERVKKV